MDMVLEQLCMSLESLLKRLQAIQLLSRKLTKSIFLIKFRYHLAEKKIKNWDSTSKQVIKPTENNGVKF